MARQFVLQIIYTHGLIQSATADSIGIGDLPIGIPNANLANDSVTVTAGTGLSGGGTVALGGSITLNCTVSPGAGTVTSVDLAAPSEFIVSGNPVTTAGTLTFAWANPTTVPHGGTGLPTLTAHALLVGTDTSTVTLLSPGTSGYPLLSQGDSADPAYGQVGTAGIADGAITYAKMQNVSGAAMLGNPSGGAVSEITLGSGLAFSGGSLVCTVTPTSYTADEITLHLSGTTFAIKTGGVTDTQVAAANKDGAAATPSIRTLGYGSLQSAPGTAIYDAQAFSLFWR